MCNQKGGVGKTTSTINLGASLAEYGRRVLLVDLDPQGALSAGLGVPHYELDHTVHNLLVEPRVSIDDVLIHTRVKDMDLVPSNIDLSAAEIQLVNEVGREQSLARALHPVLDRYDYVLIDCQPSLGLLTVNGLACADGVIIPTECEYFSLRGLALLTDTVDKVRDRLNPKLDISGILITRYDPRTVNSREVMARVRGAVRRSGVRHRHHPHGALPGDQRRRRTDHHVGAEIRWRRGLSVVGPRGHRPVRRVNTDDAADGVAADGLPGPAEQFRGAVRPAAAADLRAPPRRHRGGAASGHRRLHRLHQGDRPAAGARRDHGVPGGRGHAAGPQGRAPAAGRRGRTTRRTSRCSRCATCCSPGCCSTGRSSTSRRCSPSSRPPRCAAIRGRCRWRTGTPTCCPR